MTTATTAATVTRLLAGGEAPGERLAPVAGATDDG